MRKTGLGEWILKSAAGQERGTAIYGDLVELAATRSRVWFWVAYTRTLVALTWRIPLAVLAVVFFVRSRGRVVGNLMMLVWGHHPIPLNDPRMHVWRVPYLAEFSSIVSLRVMFTLWILLPYVAIRFGMRNRLSYLAGVLFLLSVPVYSFRPAIYQVTGVACAVVILAALASAAWRREMIFLLANLPVVAIAFYLGVQHAPGFLRHGQFPLSVFHMRIDDPIAIAITAIVAPLLHRWLLESRTVGVAHA